MAATEESKAFVIKQQKEQEMNWQKFDLSNFKLILLICLFGTGSWVEINGIWVELPLLVNQSPQSWSLPSYLSVAIQIANIGPILYYILNRCVTRNGRNVITEIPVIYFILAVGVISCIMLAFLWDATSTIAGKEYSAALIALSFVLATVDCTSSLTFLPFMAYFPAKYMTAYYIGEGMSGFLPSIAALIQGIGGQSYTCGEQVVTRNLSLSTGVLVLRNVTEVVPSFFSTKPRFSTRAFFLFVGVMMLFSLASFFWLVRIKKLNDDRTEKLFPLKNTRHAGEYDSTTPHDEQPATEKVEITNRELVFLLLINGIINGLSNGVLPSLQSYACLSYSQNIYHLTLVLSALANPLACFLYFFVSLKSTFGIVIGVLIYVASAGYTIGIAATSPCPIWNDSQVGGILVLLVTVFGVALVSYLKTAISTVLRDHGHTVLFWCGISVQVGSFIGAVTIFPLVNVYGMFKQAMPCQQCS